MDTTKFLEELGDLGYANVQHKVDIGAYSSRRQKVAETWLKRNAPILPQQQPNVLVIVAPKSKAMRWIFEKLGIGQDKTNLIEHDGS